MFLVPIENNWAGYLCISLILGAMSSESLVKIPSHKVNYVLNTDIISGWLDYYHVLLH